MSLRLGIGALVLIAADRTGKDRVASGGTGGCQSPLSVLMPQRLGQNRMAGFARLGGGTGSRGAGVVSQGLAPISLVAVGATGTGIDTVALFRTGGQDDPSLVTMTPFFRQNRAASQTDTVIHAIRLTVGPVPRGRHKIRLTDLSASLAGMGGVSSVGTGGFCHRHLILMP